MTITIITLSIVIVVGIIMIAAISIYNQLQDYIIRINEAEANIDSVLRKRFDLLNKAISVIKSNVENVIHIQRLK